MQSTSISSRSSILRAGSSLRRPTPPTTTTSTRPRTVQVTAAKGERVRIGNPRDRAMSNIPTPPIDPDNEEFVVFVRSKALPVWQPLTMFVGSPQANLAVRAMRSGENPLMRDTLIRQIGETIYKDKKQVMKVVQKASKALSVAKEVEFGFKIRDKTQPSKWFVPTDVIMIPDEVDLPKAPLQDAAGKVSEFFSNVGESLGVKPKEDKGPEKSKSGFSG